jgi:iduronate 2-sulfatase
MKKNIFTGILLFIHVLVFSATGKYNVLFISVDDLRPELNCYGSSGILTPNIDKLAKEGMLFTNAYSQQAICTPSRISMLSGLRPSTTGIYDLTDKLKNEAPSVVSMPHVFKNSGYQTISLGKVFHHQDDDPDAWSENAWRPGSSDGTWYFQGHLNASPYDYGLDGKTLYGPPVECVDVADNWYYDGLIAERAIEKLDELKDEEFFLAVGFMKPHLPFTAPKKYWDLYDPGDISIPSDEKPDGLSQFSTTEWQELRNYFGMPKSGDIQEDQARQLIHGYRACVSYIDTQIGKVIDKLDELGLRENTIIVLWSDHGWKLGEYGDWCKHTNFEIDLRTPLIVDVPGHPGGMKCEKMVESVDLFPTMMDLTLLDGPEGLDGLSFSSLLESPDNPWKSAAFSQYPRWTNSRMGTTVRTHDYRYTEYILESTGELISSELYKHGNNTPLELETENLITQIESNNEIGRIRDYMKRLLELGWDAVREGTTIELKESTSSTVILGINNVSNAVEYKLFMSKNGGGFEEVLPGAIDRYSTEITVEGLSADDSYAFQLKLNGDNYQGGVSNIIEVSPENYQPLIENGIFSNGLESGWKYNSNNGADVSYAVLSMDGYESVLQAKVTGLGTNFWDVGMINLKNNSLDTALIHISFNAKSSMDGAELTCGFQSRTSPSVTRYQTIVLGTEWGNYNLDISIEENLRNDWQFKCFFINTADYYIDSIMAGTSVDEVHETEQWEIEADERIDTLRKGDFDLQILGSDGQPLANTVQEIRLIEHDFVFGSMLKLGDEIDSEDNWAKSVALKYFNLGVISNEFKWSGMQPDENPPIYHKVDQYLNWAVEYDFDMKGHVLLWGGTGDDDASDYHKLPEWVRYNADGTTRTASEIEALIEDRIKNTVDYYKDRIYIYDVLNEASPSHADWLQNTIGDEINRKVFEWAYETAPNAEFLINDYSILTSENVDPGSQIYAYVNLIKNIQAYVPEGIHTIGCQSHLNDAVPDNYYENISYLNQQTGLPISITEFDLRVDKYSMSNYEMAMQYRKALKLAFSHPAVQSFILWGYHDANHWRAGAGLFDENKVPKYAAFLVHDLIHNEWNTRLHEETDAIGEISFNGYYGWYEVICEIDGEKRVSKVQLTKDKEETRHIINFSEADMMYPEVDSVRMISGNKIAVYFSMEMEETSLQLSEFNVFSTDEVFVTAIDLSEDKKIAYLETNHSLARNGFSQMSYLGKSACSLEGELLRPFGPEEILSEVDEKLLYYELSADGAVILGWDFVPAADSVELCVLNDELDWQTDTVVISSENYTSAVRQLENEREYTYIAHYYSNGEYVSSSPITFYYSYNLLENYGFEYEYRNWMKEVNSIVAQAEFEISADASEENAAAKITVLQAAYPRSVSVSTETSFNLKAGQVYELSFDAKTLHEESEILLSVLSPENELVFEEYVQLSTQYCNHSFLFEAVHPSKYTIRLSLGGYETEYYLDNFSLKTTTDTLSNIVAEEQMIGPERSVRIFQEKDWAKVMLSPEEEIQSLKLYQINGQLIYKQNGINSREYSFNTAEFSTGVYILTVNKMYSGKLICF